VISISLNKSLWIQLVNFIVLVFILNALLYKPIREAIRQRKERIKKDEEEVSHLNAEARRRLEEFEMALEEARREGMKRKEGVVDSARQEEKGLLDKAREEMEEYLNEMRARISQDIKAAEEKLKDEIKVIAVDIAQKILGRPISHE